MGAPAYQPIRRLTADEVLRMVDAGIVHEDEPVQLLEGVLVEMSPQGPVHAATTTALADRLRAAYLGRGHVREEKPLAANPYSLPEPDIAVVRGQVGSYAARHPNGDDVILVVEVAWSSQVVDRQKAAIYAAANVPVYWLVDLAARKLEVRTTPEGGAYRAVEVLDENAAVSLPGLAERWLVGALVP
jgi:Uma2 family endonuclease